MFNFLLSFTQTTMIIIWIIVIALGIIIESQTDALVSIWFSAGAAGGLLCSLAKLDVYIQIIVFALLTFVLVIATRPLAKKLMNNTEVKTNADKLVGMTGVVTKNIETGEKGSIKINFQDWTAISDSNQTIPVGTKVVVKEIVGNKLVVDNIEEIEIK